MAWLCRVVVHQFRSGYMCSTHQKHTNTHANIACGLCKFTIEYKPIISNLLKLFCPQIFVNRAARSTMLSLSHSASVLRVWVWAGTVICEIFREVYTYIQNIHTYIQCFIYIYFIRYMLIALSVPGVTFGQMMPTIPSFKTESRQHQRGESRCGTARWMQACILFGQVL